MNLNEITRDQALSVIRKIKNSNKKLTDLDSIEDYFLGQIQYYVEQEVIKEIRDRQNKIPGMRVNYKAIWGCELTPGCENCLDGTGLFCIRAASTCNLDCKFCYYYKDKNPKLLPDHYMINYKQICTSDDIIMMLDKQRAELKGMAWVYYEPFMELDKHLRLIRHVSEKGIHQHMYTNGTLCDEDQFKMLHDCGLNELRFNLAATHCSRSVLKNMKVARKYFKYLCIESPMYKEYYDSFINNKTEILNTGVDQINCAELHIQSKHLDMFPGPLYRYKYAYVSPIESRRLTYDLIEMAYQEKWQGVTILDCSNETKYYRSFMKNKTVGNTNWGIAECALPIEWYEEALVEYDVFENICLQESCTSKLSNPDLISSSS